MSNRKHFSSDRSRRRHIHNYDQRTEGYYERDYGYGHGYGNRGSRGYGGGRQRFQSGGGSHVNRSRRGSQNYAVSKNSGGNKYKSKRSKWKKVAKIESMDSTLSEKVIYCLNHLETIFTFLNFLDLIGIGSLLSRYHYSVVFFNQENVSTLPKSKKSAHKDNCNNIETTYPNRIFLFCFKNTFKNLIKLVLEPSVNESLPNLTIGTSGEKGDDIPLIKRADKKAKHIMSGKFEYNKKQIYPLFTDWFYLMKQIVESNTMFVQYGRDSIVGERRQADEYRNQKWIFGVNENKLTYNLCLLLAIDDAQFVQYWLTKVKKN